MQPKVLYIAFMLCENANAMNASADELEFLEWVRLGRHSGAKRGTISLERAAYAGNRPAVTRVTGYKVARGAGGEPQVEIARADADWSERNLSRGGNGYFTWSGLADGFYIAEDVLYSGSRTGTVCVAMSAAGVAAVRGEWCAEMASAMAAAVPAELLAAQVQCAAQTRTYAAAQHVLNQIEAARRAVPAHADAELVAKPTFAPSPAQETVEAAVTDPGFDEAAFVAAHSAPAGYAVAAPLAAVGSDGPAAVAVARALLARRAEAVAVIEAVAAARAAVPVHEVGEIAAQPVFGALPDVCVVEAAVARADYNRETAIGMYAAPIRWAVEEPVYGTGPDAASAVSAALAEMQRRADAAVAAHAREQAALLQAESLALPKLKGTPKQIAWAMQIRAEVAAKNARHPSLRRATTAHFWIENRRELASSASASAKASTAASMPTTVVENAAPSTFEGW